MGLDASDQRLCDSLIEKKHSKTWYMQKSLFQLVSVAEQTGFKTDFLTSQPISKEVSKQG